MKSLGGSEDKDGDKKEAPDEGEEAVHTDPGKKKAVPVSQWSTWWKLKAHGAQAKVKSSGQ